MRLDLADLRLFLAVVEAGSITQGAQRANLALASASERLRAIEDDAGVQLLERRSRGISLTEAGAALAHHARLILRQRDALQGELRAFAAGARGTLSLYANTAALTEFLPARLAPWLAARPQLNVDLKERTSVEIVKAIEAGLVEAGIVTDAVDAGTLQLIPVADDPLVVLTEPGHPLAGRRQLAFADILHETFVGFPAGSAIQEHLDGRARSAGHPLALRIRLPSYEGVCEMVAHGIGIAVLPASVARRYRRRYDYRAIPLRESWAERRLCLCYRDRAGLSAATGELMDYLAGTSDS